MLKVGNYIIDNPKLEVLVGWLEANGEPNLRENLQKEIKGQLSDSFKLILVRLEKCSEHCIDDLWIKKDCIKEVPLFNPNGWNKLEDVTVPKEHILDTVLIYHGEGTPEGPSSFSDYSVGTITKDKVVFDGSKKDYIYKCYFKIIK